MAKSLRTSGLADLVSVTPQTIRAWVKKGQIPYHETPGGTLYFTPEDVEIILGGKLPEETEEKWVYYVRSSSGRKTSKDNQTELLALKYPKPIKIISDSASGLNENRRGIKQLIKLAQNREITDIAVTNEDRLSRFGNSYLKALFAQNGVTVHYLNVEKDKPMERELVDDFMALIASFSGRFYKMRSKENQQKLLDLAHQELNKMKSDVIE